MTALLACLLRLMPLGTIRARGPNLLSGDAMRKAGWTWRSLLSARWSRVIPHTARCPATWWFSHDGRRSCAWRFPVTRDMAGKATRNGQLRGGSSSVSTNGADICRPKPENPAWVRLAMADATGLANTSYQILKIARTHLNSFRTRATCSEQSPSAVRGFSGISVALELSCFRPACSSCASLARRKRRHPDLMFFDDRKMASPVGS